MLLTCCYPRFFCGSPCVHILHIIVIKKIIIIIIMIRIKIIIIIIRIIIALLDDRQYKPTNRIGSPPPLLD
jgi:hypothetical protein